MISNKFCVAMRRSFLTKNIIIVSGMRLVEFTRRLKRNKVRADIKVTQQDVRLTTS